LQLPFCRRRLPSPAAIMRHFTLTDSVVGGAPSVTATPAQSAGIRFGVSVTIPGGGLAWKTVESRSGLNPPDGARPVPVVTSNTLRVLEVAERIMCSSKGHISVLRTHAYSCCSVVKVIHLIDYGSGLGDSTHLVLSCLWIFCFAVPKKEEEGQALVVSSEGKRGSLPCLSLPEITAMSRVKRFSGDSSRTAMGYPLEVIQWPVRRGGQPTNETLLHRS